MKRILLAVLLLSGAMVASSSESNEITLENTLALMNAYRAESGLPPLHLDAKLSEAAEDRMRDMEYGGWWSHVSPEGKPPFEWIKLREYDYLYAGENLAAGYETARVLVQSWMESPGHRANIMGAQFADCGIAIIEGSTKGPAMGKSVVVLFGRRKVSLVTVK